MSGSPSAVTIAVLPGDGIGPEITAVAAACLRAVLTSAGVEATLTEHPIGGAAVDVAGDPLPPATLAACESSDAILLGAVGGPKWDSEPKDRRPEQGLLRLRKSLGLYANLRPVTLHPALTDRSPLRPDLVKGVDMLVVRELTGGVYFGARARGGDGPDAYATDECRYSVREIERISKIAFEAAARRAESSGRPAKVTSLDKANVLGTSRLWRETVTRVAASYPAVELEHQLIDSAAMRVITRPADFDVILTENMFGDIISDETSVLAGSLGVMGSASLGDPKSEGGTPGLFEPIHGSAPDIAGAGVANPIGTCRAAAMLLRDGLQMPNAAASLERAIDHVLEHGPLTPDLAGSGTTASVGDALMNAIASQG